MDSVRDELIAALEAGSFLRTVHAMILARTGDDDSAGLAAQLAELHNAGGVDLVTEFLALKNDPQTGLDFFLLQHVLEQALPQINAPVAPVTDCVRHVYHEATPDGVAGMILDAFRTYCENDPARPEEALTLLKGEAETEGLLAAVLAAGLAIDPQHYVRTIFEYASQDDDCAMQGLIALRQVQWERQSELLEPVYAGLDQILEGRTDDRLLAEILKTAVSLLKADSAYEARVASVAETVVSKGGEYAMHAAAALLAFSFAELPQSLSDTLASRLTDVNPVNTATIGHIDRYLAKLLKAQRQDRAIAMTETFLLTYSNDLSLKHFHSLNRVIDADKPLLHRLVTRWLCSGQHALCNAAAWLADRGKRANIVLDIDPAELQPQHRQQTAFVARKALGYLFYNPVSAASILIALIHYEQDHEQLDQLGELLFDPLLVNWPGKARDYVAQQADAASGRVKQVLDKALASLEAYLEDLRAIGTVPELHPSTWQREDYIRYMSRLTAEAYQQAEAQSAFLNIIQKSVILYGRKSINYVYGADGQAHRAEIPLKGHSVVTEIPRSEHLDPLGMQVMLHAFRAERLES